mgnify:CR=1 FL=1
MSLRLKSTLLLVPVLLLAACEDEVVVSEGADGREASGEVLEGTISDEMIHTDQLRSQPPLLRSMPEVEEGDEGAEGEGEPAEGEAPSAEVAAVVEVPPAAPPQSGE